MNHKLEKFKDDIRSKKVAVLGMGVSNTPLIEYLLKMGVDVTVFDKAEPDALKSRLVLFKDYPLHCCLGSDYLSHLTGFDVIFRTPGIRYDLPELKAATEKGAVLTSEMEVFFELCPAEIFAITGSDGKTTTTTIIWHLLKEAGYNCYLGGNIGTPLLNRIDEITENDKVILELSSFQLHTMTRSPHVAVITNLSPNHLDYHTSMNEYVEAKKSIYLYQGPQDRLVLNHDNTLTRELAQQASSKVTWFSRTADLPNGAIYKDGRLYFAEDGDLHELVERSEVKLPGDHNVENYLAAIAATWGYVTPEIIHKVATSLESIEHRIEFVRELDDVRYYNDSIASSPTRTMASLNAFDQRVILIAGGYDKNIPYTPMIETLIRKVKHLILLGQTASLIEMALMKSLKGKHAYTDIRITNCSNLEQAVYTAYFSAKPGDIVLLSPASASFDMFRDFEERGRFFKDVVMKLVSRRS